MITIRYAQPSDLNFIVDSFLQSYWNSAAVRGMTRDAYFTEMRPRLKRILANQTVITKVACSEDDEDVLLGWSSQAGSTLVYVYVKKEMRGTGLGRALVDDSVSGYMFRSQSANRIPNGWTYEPFRAWSLSS